MKKNPSCSIVRDDMKIEFVRLGEGFRGDYNPKDPTDEELLRFDVSVKRNGRWEPISSLCTAFPADTTKKMQKAALKLLMDKIYSAYEKEKANGIERCKPLIEWMSWIEPSWITDGIPAPIRLIKTYG